MLSTDRLILRPLSTDHVEAVLADNRRDHWAPDYPDEGDRDIAKMLTAQFRPGQYQIIERSSGLAVGGIGLFWPATDGAVEFGYGVVRSRRGLGYATEAARRIILAAFADPTVRCVYADVEGDNPASVRVLQKSGLRQVNPGRYATDRPLDASALQQHQRGSARPVGSFVLHFDDQSANPFRNYAVPVGAPSEADVTALVAEFRRRNRQPRLEFVAPGGAPGFVVRQRFPVMSLRAADLRTPPEPAGVTIQLATWADDLRAAAEVQNAAYGVPETTAADVARLRSTVDRGGAVVLARQRGIAVGAGLHTPLRGGLAEIAAIGVAENWRGRGIAASLCHRLTQNVLRQHAIPFLQTEGEAGRRSYRRLGYEIMAELCAATLTGGQE